MAINTIMTSTRALTTPSSSSLTPRRATTPKLPLITLPKASLPEFPITKKALLPAISITLAPLLIMAPPSLAVEIEKAALFDFNLTLPIIVVEFLFLMFALDKIYYTPLGNFMDERDATIREKLNSVKDTSAEVKQLEDQAAAIMRGARAEIASALNKMKKETQIEVEQRLAEGRRNIEAELQEALENLEKQKEDTIKALDSQIVSLSKDIVKKVLPIS